MKDMRLSNIANILGGEAFIDGEDREVTGVVIDNRNVEEGYLFIPIKGERVDGHEFIDNAFERGAACVLSECELKEPKGSYIKVESTEWSLKRLAAFYRTRLNIPIIGVVGSVGKTSTKEMVSSVLSQRFNVLYTKGNLNNEIGLPLTLLRINENHDVAVCEMGIAEFGEMSRLGEIAQPDMVVFTNVRECHLEFLNDRDGVLKAKSEVFDYVLSGGSIFLNTDDDKLATIKNIPDKRIISYGTASQEVRADNIRDLGIEGIDAMIHSDSFDIEVHIGIPGAHNIYHALAAAAVGERLGLTKEEIKDGIEGVSSIGGRNNLIRVNEKLLVIDDCYNASPASVNAAIDLLSKANGKKIAVLGDMGELGIQKEQLHYDIGTNLGFDEVDVLYTAGELSKNIGKAILEKGYKCIVKSFNDKDEMIKGLTCEIKDGGEDTVVLVKASHFMGFNAVVDALLAYRQ